ncbi:MAG: response regulator [Nitrospirae bacterium]|nr:response regulator [Candidatus Troglogloeales bacterium]
MESELAVSEKKEESTMLVVCPHCQTNIKIHVDLSLKLEVPVEVLVEAPAEVPVETLAEAPVEEPAEAPETVSDPYVPKIAQPLEFQLDVKKVAIAINGEGTREIIKEMLEDAQFEVNDVASLEALFALLRQCQPATVLVDLSLPGATEIQLSEAMAKELSPNKANLLLVSPGYGKAMISPEIQVPFSGADGYIERGNIQKDLIHTIKSCLGLETDFSISEEKVSKVAQEEPQVQPEEKLEEESSFSLSPPMPVIEREKEEAAPISPVEEIEAVRVSPIPVEESLLPPPLRPEVNQKELESAKRLARIIVSDIILYNEKKVEEGVLHGTFYDLLQEEIEEGRQHYTSRVSLEIQKQRDYLGDVFEDFLKKRRTVSA